jgi:hypothetical protein
MAVKMKLAAGVTVVWGTAGVSNQGFGKLMSVSRAHGAEREKIPDEEGNTVGAVWFDEDDVLTLEVLCSSAATNPDIADTITADGVSGYVDNWEKKWDHKGTKKLSIKCTRFASGGIP